jgi:hypothetical protein
MRAYVVWALIGMIGYSSTTLSRLEARLFLDVFVTAASLAFLGRRSVCHHPRPGIVNTWRAAATETIPPSLVLITIGSVTGVRSPRCSRADCYQESDWLGAKLSRSMRA